MSECKHTETYHDGARESKICRQCDAVYNEAAERWIPAPKPPCKHINQKHDGGVDTCLDCHMTKRSTDDYNWQPGLGIRDECDHKRTRDHGVKGEAICLKCNEVIKVLACTDCRSMYPAPKNIPNFYQPRCGPCGKKLSQLIADKFFPESVSTCKHPDAKYDAMASLNKCPTCEAWCKDSQPWQRKCACGKIMNATWKICADCAVKQSKVFSEEAKLLKAYRILCVCCKGSFYHYEETTQLQQICPKCVDRMINKNQIETKQSKTAYRLCDAIAEDSKDQSTKLGSVILGPGNETRSTGYNSFPRKINDNVKARQERPWKYHFMAHAEENAITNAARIGCSVAGCTIYCQWPPCSSCARMIIGSGIAEVFCRDLDVPLRRTDEVIAACEMLVESKVKFVLGEVILASLYNRRRDNKQHEDDTCGDPDCEICS